MVCGCNGTQQMQSVETMTNSRSSRYSEALMMRFKWWSVFKDEANQDSDSVLLSLFHDTVQRLELSRLFWDTFLENLLFFLSIENAMSPNRGSILTALLPLKTFLFCMYRFTCGCSLQCSLQPILCFLLLLSLRPQISARQPGLLPPTSDLGILLSHNSQCPTSGHV